MNSEDSNLQDKLDTFSSNATLHGIHFICSKGVHIVKRITWLIILLAVIILTIFLLTDTIIKFFGYSAVVSFTMEHNETFQYPAITICNINGLKLSNAQQYFPEMINFSKYMFLDPYSEVIPQLAPSVLMTGSNYTFTRFMEVFSHNEQEVFVQCLQQLNVKINCSEYITNYHNDRGMCFTYNSGQNSQSVLETSRAGMVNGITITIDIDPDDYIYPATLATGMFVLIHDQTTFPRIDERAFIIGPGKEIYISLNKEKHITLSTPYNTKSCIGNEKLTSSENDIVGSHYFGYPYSEEACLQDNLIHEWESALNCSFYGTKEANGCTLTDFILGSTSVIDFQRRASLKTCVPLCEQVIFKHQISTAEFPNKLGEEYAKYHNWNITDFDEMRKRYSQIHLFYETMKYMVIEQHAAIDVGQLFSNIGGQMGFYLGASIITFVEMIDFLIGLCVSYVSPRKVKNVKKIKQINIQPIHMHNQDFDY